MADRTYSIEGPGGWQDTLGVWHMSCRCGASVLVKDEPNRKAFLEQHIRCYEAPTKAAGEKP